MNGRTRSWRGLAAVGILAVLAAAAGPVSANGIILAGSARVVDGDTLEIGGERIRIEGIDAPEQRQTCTDAAGNEWACGAAATDLMKTLTAGRETVCAGSGRDRYGRVIATCRAGGVDVAAELVRQGLALAYRRYSMRYAGDEDLAREAKIGMWSGAFMAPWDWRRAH